MQKQQFGKTGHNSSRLLFGAAAFYGVSQSDADRTMDLIAEKGINHIDTAASYGLAEERLGPWLKTNRNSVFLATKTDKRSKTEALEELKRSLELMNTDHVDLWQMHCLIDPGEWEQAFGPGGVLEAFIEAREQGMAKYLGVTGHELVAPRMHLRSLEAFDFDSVLLPYNYALMRIPEYRADFEKLRSLCREKNIAVQIIKTVCRGPWGNKPHHASTWYEPFTYKADIATAIGYALQQDGVFVNSAGDITILPHVIDAYLDFDPSNDYGPAMERLAEEKGMEPLFV